MYLSLAMQPMLAFQMARGSTLLLKMVSPSLSPSLCSIHAIAVSHKSLCSWQMFLLPSCVKGVLKLRNSSGVQVPCLGGTSGSTASMLRL